MRICRWVLLPIAGITAWIAVLLTGVAAHNVAEFFCPADQLVSGMCVAPWFETIDVWLIRFFSAFAAALIIVSCYFTAPAERNCVAWIVFGAGGVYAVWIAIISWAWGEFVAAGIGGIITVLLLTRRPKFINKIDRVALPKA